MIKTIVIMVVVLQGMIHLFGCAKASDLLDTSESGPMALRVNAALWLFGASLFMVTAVSFFNESELWWVPAGGSILISQYVIYTTWREARFDTIINIVIVLLTLTYKFHSFT